MESTTIGFIGAGNMANSMIRGLLAKQLNAQAIWAADIDELKLQQLRDECGINASTVEQLVDSVDVIVLAVKPQAMKEVCEQLASCGLERSPLILSIAAGINTFHLRSWLGEDRAIVRCMPNTPALVGKGASGLFANEFVSDSQKQVAEQIMAAVGLSVWVVTEADIDTVTAVSGSGPAYFFLFMEAIQNAAKDMGISEELARQLTYQTALGAAELALNSTDEIAVLRRNVSSPGGTTEQAIKKFEAGGLRELVASALQAARDRSIELADEFGQK